MKFQAFFIMPDSTIIPVEGSHIEKIIEMPAAFGLTRKKILAAYREFNEKPPIEGWAREKILKNTLKQEVIRVRYRDIPDAFTVELFKYDDGAKKRLKKWATFITKKKNKVPLQTGFQVIETRRNGKTYSGTLKDLLK